MLRNYEDNCEFLNIISYVLCGRNSIFGGAIKCFNDVTSPYSERFILEKLCFDTHPNLGVKLASFL